MKPVRIRLLDVDLGDELRAQVIARRLNVLTVKRVHRSGRPFRPELSWTRTFDVRSGFDLGDDGAFRIHPDDLAQFAPVLG